MEMSDIHDLPVAEKLKLVTQLWDEIAESGQPLELPTEVIQEALRRSAEMKADPSVAIDDEELWRRIDG